MNENKNNNSNEKQSFIEKIKTDKKYRAKVELAGYVVIVVLIIIYLNVSNIGNNYEYNSVISNSVKNDDVVVEENEDKDLLEEINDNYAYDVVIEMTSKANEEVNIVNKKYNYNGKVYKDNIIINKTIDGVTGTYYKVMDEYYILDGENYKIVKDNEVYDLLEAKYIEYDETKKYIDKASLDHVTNYSSGKKEYVYNLKVSDVIGSYKGEDAVSINIVVDNNIITMNIDYTNLLKLIDDSISDCKLVYTYKDINKVEKFIIIEDEKTEEDSNEKLTDN